jgi:NADH-quinone oxidoreductase subunit H
LLSSSNKIIFIFSAVLTLFLSIMNWAIVPFNLIRGGLTDINLGILYIFFISSFSVYGISFIWLV